MYEIENIVANSIKEKKIEWLLAALITKYVLIILCTSVIVFMNLIKPSFAISQGGMNSDQGTTHTVRNILDHSVNLSDVPEAQSFDAKNGEIIFSTDKVSVSGKVDVVRKKGTK